MKLGWIRLLVETIVEQWVWVTQLLLPVPLLNPHPEGAPNAKPTRALKGGVGSHVSGGGALKHNLHFTEVTHTVVNGEYDIKQLFA